MSQYPPNNSQPPWQGNQSQHLPQPPWGVPPDQPSQWGQPHSQLPPWQPTQYNQPTQGWQQPVPPPPLQRGGKPPKKPFTKQNKIIGIGCLGVLLLSLCITCAAINSVNGNNSPAATVPTTIVAIPSDTPTTIAVQAVLPTDTPTAAPTDTPIPTPTTQPTPKPTPTPTQPIVQQPTPTPAPHCVAVNNNPWCYNFITPGNVITNPPSTFCSYFNCVSTFWTANHGYVAECVNGSYTHSGGVSGACSRDGGVSQTLYSH